MITTLLDKNNSTLSTLSLKRITLDIKSDPQETLHITNAECLIYPLIGEIFVDDICMGGRKSILNKPRDAMRILNDFTGEMEVQISLGRSRYADLLLVSLNIWENPVTNLSTQQRCIVDEFVTHTVGKGTHRRQVRVIEEQPESFHIYAGETLQKEGTWSSWPAHASSEDIGKWSEFQEVMWFATPTYGLIVLDGFYNDGSRADGIEMIRNNTARVTPLGSHPIVCAPDVGGFLYYFWAYTGSALVKTYNSLAHDLGVYVK